MEYRETLALVLFYIGVLITWSIEAAGSVIKIHGMKMGANLVSASFVQAIGVFSRLGFFLQSYASAWIVDESFYPEKKPAIAVGYFMMVFISVLFSQTILSRFIWALMSKHPTFKQSFLDPSLKSSVTQKKLNPSVLQVFGYLMLYSGGFSPIVLHLLSPEFVARSVALSGLINGVSSIILVAYYDIKTSLELASCGFSAIPYQLLRARYVALLLLTFAGFLWVYLK